MLRFLNPMFLFGVFIGWFDSSVDSGIEYMGQRRIRKIQKRDLTATKNSV